MTIVQLTAVLITCLANASDPRSIENGWEIPSEGYVDQPYVVVLPDGAWLCTLTTGPGPEGNDQQHVVATRSEDKGRTWSPLVDIEPHGPPESSWVMPLLVAAKSFSSPTSGDDAIDPQSRTAGIKAASVCDNDTARVYAFYVYNADNLREVKASTEYARQRVDTLGTYVFRYSDDGGRTWSAERYTVPIREFAIDRENPYAGEVRFFWGVGKPMVHKGAAYLGLAKVGSFGTGFVERSEGFFLRSDNILTERDTTKLRWETLPDGEVGLRAPLGPIAEEHNLVSLNDGRLYCTYRTTDGHPCDAYSRDDGHTWTSPAYMNYTPTGRLVKHPRAANFVRRFSNGKYLYWFHNHGGTSYEGRNPAWLSGGVEHEGVIHWSEPEIVLYADDPKIRMSYPDFIEDTSGIYITETQKLTARVHPIEKSLLEGLWGQFENRAVPRDGLTLELYRQDLTSPGRFDLDVESDCGITIEIGLSSAAVDEESPILETRDAQGYGWSVTWRGSQGFRLTLDSAKGSYDYDTDPIADSAWRQHHLVIGLDPGSGILTFVLNGKLCDGADLRPQGWCRMPDGSRPWPGIHSLGLVPLPQGELTKLRVYDRYLRTSEAIGNWRMEHTLQTEGTDDDD